jgi:hypothetical protein
MSQVAKCKVEEYDHAENDETEPTDPKVSQCAGRLNRHIAFGQRFNAGVRLPLDNAQPSHHAHGTAAEVASPSRFPCKGIDK